VNNPKVAPTFHNVLSAFSPRSKLRRELPATEQVDILIGTDCISEGQNLQDCDCVINYDVQWNPVTLIQRFGRIDRIGSKNTQIKMINFFPDLDLNEYLSLEARVKRKMIGVNLTATGGENDLSPEMNDISFRSRQLARLKDEVIELEDANENLSLTDLNMNDYLHELSEYLKHTPEIRQTPSGIYSITHAPEDSDRKHGVLFCFKHRNLAQKPKSDSSLYPYYLVYVSDQGSAPIGKGQARELLKFMRRSTRGQRTWTTSNSSPSSFSVHDRPPRKLARRIQRKAPQSQILHSVHSTHGTTRPPAQNSPQSHTHPPTHRHGNPIAHHR
jgi:superfamily II DNA/RNA helicase